MPTASEIDFEGAGDILEGAGDILEGVGVSVCLHVRGYHMNIHETKPYPLFSNVT